MQSRATEYTVGFMLSPDRSRVALIRKSKPAWQAGKFNGIGGRIEPDEAPVAAMVREFREETGAETSMDQWGMYCEMGGINDDGGKFVVYFFVTTGDLKLLKSPTEEQVWIHPLNEFHSQRTDMLDNLAWLLALAVDHHTDGSPTYVIASYGNQYEPFVNKKLRKALEDLVGASGKNALMALQMGLERFPDSEDKRVALGGIKALLETA